MNDFGIVTQVVNKKSNSTKVIISHASGIFDIGEEFEAYLTYKNKCVYLTKIKYDPEIDITFGNLIHASNSADSYNIVIPSFEKLDLDYGKSMMHTFMNCIKIDGDFINIEVIITPLNNLYIHIDLSYFIAIKDEEEKL